MKRLFTILSAILLSCTLLRAQETPVVTELPHLSDSAYAAILTCGAGDEFYTSFGHSAVRICDSTQGIDVVYNYGTFDFDIPHFYWTFARGHLNYCLSRTTFDNFLFTYGYEQRAVWQQQLRLTPQETNNLFVMLENNYLPEYRYYLYDFFRDNCATRVRDMVANSLCHRALSPECVTDTNLTYRNLLYRSTEKTLLWWRFGVDLCLGQRCDHRCSNYEYMFSPLEMMSQFDTLTVSDTGEPLANPAQQLLADTRDPASRSVSPTLTFWLLFFAVAILTFIGWGKNWRLRWLDIILFLLPFLISLLVIFLWIFSSHYCAKVNLNILWASPLFIYFLVRLRKSRPWLVVLQMLMLLWVVVMTIAPLPQQLNAAVMPIALTLFIRLLAQLRHRA